MYHVAQGAYYSQDLRDGQFIPSILSEQYLQAGVRVDGCSRKLIIILHNLNSIKNFSK